MTKNTAAIIFALSFLASAQSQTYSSSQSKISLNLKAAQYGSCLNYPTSSSPSTFGTLLADSGDLSQFSAQNQRLNQFRNQIIQSSTPASNQAPNSNMARNSNRKEQFGQSTPGQLIKNGGFQFPFSSEWDFYSNGIPGWSADTLEIGVGTTYNSLWGKTQICELDSTSNQKVVQSLNYLIPGQTYILTYKWAARSGLANTSGGIVFWNGKVIENIVPTDCKIHSSKFVVTAVEGSNILQFDGSSASDQLGLGIDDVSLVASGNVTSPQPILAPKKPSMNFGTNYH